MRKIILSIVAMSAFCATSVAQKLDTADQPEPGKYAMPVVADIGASILNDDGSVFTVYPAEVTLVGQWCDIALWKGPFSITEFPSFRVTLLRGTEEDGLVQLFARNIYSSQNYKGPYMPFKKDQRVLEGDFVDYDDEDHSGGYFDDDPICTWFALQKTNKGDESRTVTVVEAVIIDEDGNEVKSCNVRNGSWKPAPGWEEPVPPTAAAVQFTGGRGIVGLYDSKIKPGTVHRFTFNTREPLPEGMTFYVVINDGDDTTLDYPVPAGETSFTAPDIDDDYLRCYLQYDGDRSEAPFVIHFESITCEVIDPANVDDAVTLQGVAHRDIYSVAGVQRSYRQHGLNIVRDRMDDGSVVVKKVIR